MLATVLELKLYQRFLDTIPQEDADNYHQVMTSTPEDPEEVRGYLNNEVVVEHLNKYEEYFHSVMSGEEGAMAQFWGIYIYLVNRLHRELQRCVKTNDVRSYISIFPKIVEVFFALNRPNYSRWGMLFLQKLETANPAVMTILEKGAFSIRRTTRNFSRSAVDLSLEQTVNKDASSSARGIVAFRNSDQALRRWALTMTQRALAVSELKSLVGIEQENGTAAQCHPSQINKDNIQMKALGKTIDTFCNPFSDEAPSTLVNIATGRAANAATQSYLLSTIRRGQEAREKFEEEWDENRKRFTQPIKKVKVANFAAENTKKGPLASASKRAQTNAENLRDAFVKMIVVASQDSAVDLRHILKYPIIKYPLAFAHCDGSLVKTDKSSLLHHLEAVQMETINELDHPELYTHVYDGGLLLHSILSQTSIGASYASIARTILSVICASKGKEVHICLDKYLEDSIKGSERKLRGAVDSAYNITGPEQTIRQSGKKLLANGMFKDQLGRFLLQEWGKEHYWHILEGKTVIASFGGDCLSFVPDKESHHITVTRPAEYQGNHEEADTLISFHVANTSASHICVRASDTDVLVILIGMLARQRPEVRAAKTVIMECGMGNSRRYINVSNITDGLEDMKTGLPEALPGFHAFTGCDFTSAFYRKGKVKPLQILEKDTTGRFIEAFVGLGKIGNLDTEAISAFTCQMYGQDKTEDVNEARYLRLIDMTGKVEKEKQLSHVKKLDCALLPPSYKALKEKIRRSNYVAALWCNADSPAPMCNESPSDYGWCLRDNLLEPLWFRGEEMPRSLHSEEIDSQEIAADEESDLMGSDEETDIEAWSEDTDSDDDSEI